MSGSRWILVVALWWMAAACSREGGPTNPPVESDKKCVVWLHGKGGTAQDGTVTGGITYLRPGGNADSWGGRQWLYYPEDRFRQVRASIASEIGGAGCDEVIVEGFSNGAAAAAKLYCRGERFDGHVSGYIIDDPVPDHAVEGCSPASGVRVRLYWTGALSVATDGWSCATQDWTCEGERTIGIEKYARALGTEVKKSIHTTHAQYLSPPEEREWFAVDRSAAPVSRGRPSVEP